MLAATLVLALGAPAPAVIMSPQDIPAPSPTQRLDQRANDFTRSSQDAVVLAGGSAGRLALAWQSRRQQGGFYGIYLRGYAEDGRALTAELQGNANTAGHQMQPSAAMAADGAVWLAWRSFGADGDQGSIIARRFTPDLSEATAEVLVNERTGGHQTDPVVAALPGGGAVVVWISPAAEGQGSEVLARRLGAAGEPAGSAWRVAGAPDQLHRTPTLATDAKGRMLVAYGRTNTAGQPQGVFVRALGPDGGPVGPEQRMDSGLSVGIEPVLDLDDAGHAVAAYLAANGEGYELFTRGMRWTTEGLELAAAPLPIPITGSGYTSGIDVRLDGEGQGLLSWSRHGVATGSDVHALRIDASGAPSGTPFVATTALDGPQRIAAARGTARSLLLPSGLAAIAWSGDAGEGDSSGANLTLFGGSAPLAKAEVPPAASQAQAGATDAPRAGAPSAGARPPP